MAVWLSGVVFLVCCHPVAALPTPDSCPMTKMSAHCDKRKKQNVYSHFVQPPPAGCVECGFLPVVFDKSRKVDQVQKQAARPLEQIAVRFDPLVYAEPRSATRAVYKRVLIPDRIFIKNCVFRI